MAGHGSQGGELMGRVLVHRGVLVAAWFGLLAFAVLVRCFLLFRLEKGLDAFPFNVFWCLGKPAHGYLTLSSIWRLEVEDRLGIFLQESSLAVLYDFTQFAWSWGWHWREARIL